MVHTNAFVLYTVWLNLWTSIFVNHSFRDSLICSQWFYQYSLLLLDIALQWTLILILLISSTKSMKIVINQILMKPLYTKLIFMYQMFEIFMVNYFRALCGLITEVFQHDKDGIEYYSQLIKPLLYDSEEGEALTWNIYVFKLQFKLSAVWFLPYDLDLISGDSLVYMSIKLFNKIQQALV